MPAELSERSRQVLFALVTEYITSGEPVSSRCLANRYAIGLSPATIRNVLADLEDGGFVHQPHTSAGRVPTDLGFRSFVNAMALAQEISDAHRIAVIGRLRSLDPSADLMRETGLLLSSLTGAAAVISTPAMEAASLTQLRFMRLSSGQILAVLELRSGVIENRVIRGQSIDANELEKVNRYLEDLAPNRSLQQVLDLLVARVESERGRYELLRQEAEAIVSAALEGSEERPVLIEGQGQLFQRPEFLDTEKIRRYLDAFEQKERLLHLLERTLHADGVQVLIGSETELGDIQDISIISTGYTRDGAHGGRLGVVGPTRMDYQRIVPLVGFTANILSDLLDKGARPDEH